MKPLREYKEHPQKRLEDIAFAKLAFSEPARAIMAAPVGEHEGTERDGGSASVSVAGGGWDRRLERSDNFLQLFRDDTCGKMRTLKVGCGSWSCSLIILYFLGGGGGGGAGSPDLSRIWCG